MSSDTRMLPRKNPHATSIPRTTTAPARPVVGGHGGSGVSASPAADRTVQQHVQKANEGRGPAPIMPPGHAAGASSSAPLAMRPPIPAIGAPASVGRADARSGAEGHRAVTIDEQQTAFLVFLIDNFLSDPEMTPEARELATRTLGTLAQMAGGMLAQQRLELAQRGEAPPPIEISEAPLAPAHDPANAPPQEG